MGDTNYRYFGHWKIITKKSIPPPPTVIFPRLTRIQAGIDQDQSLQSRRKQGRKTLIPETKSKSHVAIHWHLLRKSPYDQGETKAKESQCSKSHVCCLLLSSSICFASLLVTIKRHFKKKADLPNLSTTICCYPPASASLVSL